MGPHWYFGVITFILSIISMSLNLLIFIPVFRLAFIAKKSSVYIIAFFNIISDLLQLAVIGFYLSLCIIADRYVISGERANSLSIIFGYIFINAWYIECLVQVVMAVNRFTVITLKKHNVFTFKTTMLIFLVLIAFTSFSAICTQYIFPCCVFIADYTIMSIMFINIEGVYSYSNVLLVSYDVFCTVSSTICYILVFRTIRNSSKIVSSTVPKGRSNQDVKYLLQFVFISLFYIFTWVFFEILPHIVPADQPQWYLVVPILICFNSSSNSVIYLTCNREVQKSFQTSWIKNKISWSKPSTTVQTTSAAMNKI